MNDNHRSNADFIEGDEFAHKPDVEERPKSAEKAKRKDVAVAEDRTDETVEQETEDTFRNAEAMPEEDGS